jgi:hypothetical protein
MTLPPTPATDATTYLGARTMPFSDEDIADATAWATLHSQIHSDQHDVEDCDRAMCRAAGEILRWCDEEAP